MKNVTLFTKHYGAASDYTHFVSKEDFQIHQQIGKRQLTPYLRVSLSFSLEHTSQNVSLWSLYWWPIKFLQLSMVPFIKNSQVIAV